VSASASLASSVPATKVRTGAAIDPAGILEKAGGSWSGRTALHGPARDLALNHRPVTRKKVSPVGTWTSTLPSQLSAKSRSASPVTGT